MKKSILTISAVVAFFMLTAVTCTDNEPFVNIKPIETKIYNSIKALRQSNGLDGPFVEQFVMVKEAQLFSASLSFGDGTLDTTGLSTHWDIIHDKLGGYNDVALLQSTTATEADDIIAPWVADSASNALLLEDLTQCGVGVHYDANNVAYITVLMMKAD